MTAATQNAGQRMGPYRPDEWRRTEPDMAIYVPETLEGRDAANQHFNVVRTPDGAPLATWTMATYENAPDQRVVTSRSTDDGQTWPAPQILDGAKPGEPEGTGLASWQFPIVAAGVLPGGGSR